MKQVFPIFGITFPTEALSVVLNIDESEIDNRFTIQESQRDCPL